MQDEYIDDKTLYERFKRLAQSSEKISKLEDAKYAIFIPGFGYYDIDKVKDQILGDRISGSNIGVVASDHFGLHFKYKPKNPLNERIAYILDRLLFRSSEEGLDAIVNPSQLIVVKCDHFPNQVLASQTIYGELIRNDLAKDPINIKKISGENFTRLYILHLLLRAGDGKTDNFILSSNNKLIAIDHEKIFSDDAVIGVNSSQEFCTTHVASLVFLVDNLFESIDNKTKEELINIDVEMLIFKLIEEIEKYGSSSEKYPAEWGVELKFKQGAIARLYRDLKAVQDFCRENANISTTHAQLLDFVNPNLSRFYREYKQYAHHKHPSIEKSIGALIHQGSPDGKKEISYEEFGLPAKRKLTTQFDLVTQNTISMGEAKQEFVNEIDYENFDSERCKKIFGETIATAREATCYQINNCAVDRWHFNQILRLPIKKIILNGVRFLVEDLNYFIAQSRAIVELYRTPLLDYNDLNIIVTGRQYDKDSRVVTSSRISDDVIRVRVNENLVFTLHKLNIAEVAHYLFQLDQYRKNFKGSIPQYLIELKKYMIASKFYEHAYKKLTVYYDNCDVDEFVCHTLRTTIYWSNKPELEDQARVTLNRNLYKELHWRHQKLFMELIDDAQIITSQSHCQLIKKDLTRFKKDNLLEAQDALSVIEKINQDNIDGLKHVYLHKDACNKLCFGANELVGDLLKSVGEDFYLTRQDLLPFIETLKEVNGLIIMSCLRGSLRLLSFKFLLGGVFQEKAELLAQHRQVFFNQTNNTLRERLADRENDLKDVRRQLDSVVKEYEKSQRDSAHSSKNIDEIQQLRSNFRAAVESTIDRCAQNQVNSIGLYIPFQEITIIKYIGHTAYSVEFEARFQHTPVLVKKLTQRKSSQKAKFERDIKLRMKFRHRNIAELLGVDDTLKEPIMVINTSSTTTLKQHLIKNLLTDQQKFRIVVGIARALYHIHVVHNTAHGNLCSENILIDDAGEPLLDNFGFSVSDTPTLLPTSAYDNVHIKYYPPEVNHRCLIARPAIDIYCFGILVCEIYSSQGQCLPFPIHDVNKAASQPYFHKFIADLIRVCAHESHIKRPNISEVLDYLEKFKPLDLVYRDKGISKLNKEIERADQLVEEAKKKIGALNHIGLTEICKLYESAREKALTIAQQTGSYRAYCIVGQLNILLLCEMNRLFGKQFTSSLGVCRDERISDAFKFFILAVDYCPEYPKAKDYEKAYAEYNPRKEKTGSDDKNHLNIRRQ